MYDCTLSPESVQKWEMTARPVRRDRATLKHSRLIPLEAEFALRLIDRDLIMPAPTCRPAVVGGFLHAAGHAAPASVIQSESFPPRRPGYSRTYRRQKPQVFDVSLLSSDVRQFRFPAPSCPGSPWATLKSPFVCFIHGNRINMNLPKFSMGIGDRFAHQGKAQLAAFVKAKSLGADVAPVWNKSNREHNIVHSEPTSVREESDAAVKTLGWKGAYFVDADHIGVKTVDRFVGPSDFFTLDVADFINKPAADADIKAFASNYSRYAGALKIPGVGGALDVSTARIEAIARKYLFAAQEAGRIYRHVEAAKGKGNFVTEVSMDETDQPQTPGELFFILASIADQKIPIQTIAPKFTGRFNKGVDYVGNVPQFEKEFNDDLAVIAHAIKEFG